MGSISKMASKCQKCPNRYICSRKYIEACAYHEELEMATTSVGSIQSMASPILRETTQINIGGIMTSVNKDDIKKELYKSLYEHLYVGLSYGA